MPQEPPLTSEQAAVFLKISERTFHYRRGLLPLPSVAIGPLVCFWRADLLRWNRQIKKLHPRAKKGLPA